MVDKLKDDITALEVENPRNDDDAKRTVTTLMTGFRNRVVSDADINIETIFEKLELSETTLTPDELALLISLKDPEKLKKMSLMPREKAKTNIKRLSDKIVYELATPGVASLQDIFISKLESGYEVKAVGENKVYVNSIPLNLPIKSYSIIDNKISLEFHSGKDFV